MNNKILPELYGASWCDKTSALKEFLDLQNVAYIFHNVDER
jgi:arsenate reductase-like glutaredoxin family protein